MKNPILFKLGKRPARHDPRTLLLADYLVPADLPVPPPRQDWGSHIAQWGMMANDRVGDCTCSAAGHLIMDWTSNAKAKTAQPTDAQVLAAYSAITGYDPRTGANDNGAVELDVLNYWRQKGVGGHKIGAYAALEPKNHDHVRQALYLFGGLYLGVALPVSAQRQKVWCVPPGGAVGEGAPGSWGGHAVPVIAYDPLGLTVVTWGALKRLTWGFFDAYCDESYACLAPDWINGRRQAPNGLDLQALQADLKKVAR